MSPATTPAVAPPTALGDASLVRILAAEPALPPAAAAVLPTALDKLFAQFAREGRCSAHAVNVEQDGRFLVMAWDGPALSGCSHDKLSQVVAQHETRSGAVMLAAPPIAIGAPGAVALVDRPGLRALLAAAMVDGATPWWDVRAATLGAWRAGPLPLAASPFARLLPVGNQP